VNENPAIETKLVALEDTERHCTAHVILVLSVHANVAPAPVHVVAPRKVKALPLMEMADPQAVLPVAGTHTTSPLAAALIAV
jgi:hypothetical protein